MLQSQLFTKTKQTAPKDEISLNAKLLIQAGFINKEMAGVYDLLPLGLKVVNKIRKIVNEEMEKIDSEEISMSSLQNKEIWKKTGRWDDKAVDVWFKSKFKNDTEVGFGWSHEEPIIEMMKSFVASYKDLPRYVHQFQNKMRNEVRAKSGIIRCREFLMKDMYAFAASEEDNMAFYKKTTDAYLKVFDRVGLGDITYVTSASGGVFTDKFSHEFQTICDSGEDIIYVNKDKKIAVNEEIFNEETVKKMGMEMKDFEQKKAAEVGNIFNFGTGKCEQMGLYFIDKDGTKKPVHLSSYGIGITRLMGVLVEVFADNRGIIWPKQVAPFQIHLLCLQQDNQEVSNKAKEIYDSLLKNNYDVLYDDRKESAGYKLKDSDLLGMPLRIVISQKTLEKNSVEIKERQEQNSKLIEIDEIFSNI
ncbi:MAG: aminoacyl--tRNA ligase-related protein [Patescibacteria group bacterium]|jgi:prolyl-tRNA synthetase